MATIEEHEAELVVRRSMAARALAFAEAPREAVDTQLAGMEQFKRYSVPRTAIRWANEHARAGYESDDVHFTVRAWLHAAEGNDAIAGELEFEALDRSYAGAVRELDGLIDAALELRAALAERADVAPRRRPSIEGQS